MPNTKRGKRVIKEKIRRICVVLVGENIKVPDTIYGKTRIYNPTLWDLERIAHKILKSLDHITLPKRPVKKPSPSRRRNSK